MSLDKLVEPLGATASANDGAPSSLIANPGRLSITCSPGKSKMVVFSTRSLSLPLKYENLADSTRAL